MKLLHQNYLLRKRKLFSITMPITFLLYNQIYILLLQFRLKKILTTLSIISIMYSCKHTIITILSAIAPLTAPLNTKKALAKC